MGIDAPPRASPSTWREARAPTRSVFAVAALRGLELRAPLGLRERIEAERERARGPARRRRLTLGGALAGATAAAALLVVLLLPGGAGGPTVVEAAELGTRPATEPAPEPGQPKLLDASAFGLPFPDWAEKFGWEPSGRRVDEIDGRRAVTVFYEKDGPRDRVHDRLGRLAPDPRALGGGAARGHAAPLRVARRPHDRHLGARRADLHPERRGSRRDQAARPRGLEGARRGSVLSRAGD